MLIRLGQFYALVLLLACLVTNIAFFAKVREPFLGNDDPTASVKTAFANLDFQGRIEKFYPQTQSKVDDTTVNTTVDNTPVDEVSDITSSLPPEKGKPAPRAETPVPRIERAASSESHRQSPLPVHDPPAESVFADPIIESPSPFAQLPQTEPEKTSPPKELEEPKPDVTVVVSERHEPNQQTVAVMAAPASVAAVVQPVIANQFKPIIVEPKSVVPVKPSSAPVWDTVDTIRERPIRYDRGW